MDHTIWTWKANFSVHTLQCATCNVSVKCAVCSVQCARCSVENRVHCPDKIFTSIQFFLRLSARHRLLPRVFKVIFSVQWTENSVQWGGGSLKCKVTSRQVVSCSNDHKLCCTYNISVLCDAFIMLSVCFQCAVSVHWVWNTKCV